MFNNLHNILKDLCSLSNFDVTQDAKFKRAQILDIVLQKWFPMHLSFWVPDSNDENEL